MARRLTSTASGGRISSVASPGGRTAAACQRYRQRCGRGVDRELRGWISFVWWGASVPLRHVAGRVSSDDAEATDPSPAIGRLIPGIFHIDEGSV